MLYCIMLQETCSPIHTASGLKYNSATGFLVLSLLITRTQGALIHSILQKVCPRMRDHTVHDICIHWSNIGKFLVHHVVSRRPCHEWPGCC